MGRIRPIILNLFYKTREARIRVTADKKLYSRVTVTNLGAGDALVAAHIHTSASGVNGGVILGIASNAADFDTDKIFSLTDVLYNS